jgi:hypothetical protein
MRWESGQATITLGLKPENVFNDIQEGISFKALPQNLWKNKPHQFM